ncbi:hypothetical protein ACIBSV_45890 [Embleya sp. NPDC050154]|uniref:hypothetical protein n=1 Tax=Embleya sp. NPDC050154 TaxID=3363988 RepID=UPI0037A3B4FD
MGRSTATAAIAVVLLAVAGCGGDDDGDTTAARTTPPPAPPSSQAVPAPSPEEAARTQALEVYRQWRALQLAVDAGDPLDEATVSRLSTGRAAELIRQIAVDTAKDRITTHGPDGALTPTATVALAPPVPTVTIVDCIDISRRYVTKADGSPYTPPPQSPRYRKTFTLTQTTGLWQVSDMRSERDRTC